MIAVTASIFKLMECDTGDVWGNFCTACNMSTAFFLGIVFLLLHDPLTEHRHNSQKPREQIADMPFWRRVYNSWCLYFSHRGVGWNYQVSIADPVNGVVY